MKLVAWDFDGVLNRGFQGGYQAWQDSFTADLGCSAESFTAFMFSGHFDAVLTGQRDLLDMVAAWVRQDDVPHAPEVVLDYWLAKDACPDDEVMGWLARCPVPGVIATNNESRRASYMWENMSFKHQMQHIFASGPLRVKKPDGRFFEAIELWSGLDPSDILLVDDARKNIDAARARGWQAFHFHDASRADLPGVLGIAP